MSKEWGRADLMVIAAVRYCLGRSSYIVGDCADWIIENWSDFDAQTKAIIQRDIEEVFARDDDARSRGEDEHRPLGMDMDRAEWEQVRALWAPRPNPVSPPQTSANADS